MGNNYSPLEKRVREIGNEVDEVNAQLDTKANLVNGKVSMEELPPMDFIPIEEKGKENGTATLDTNRHIPLKNIKVGANVRITQTGTGDLTFTGIDFNDYNVYEFYIICSASSNNSFDVYVEDLKTVFNSAYSEKYIKIKVYSDGTIEEEGISSFYANYTSQAMVNMLNNLCPRITEVIFPENVSKIVFKKRSGSTDSMSITVIPRRI